MPVPEPQKARWALILGVAAALSLATVYVQVMHLEFAYIEHGTQLQRHRAVLDGSAGDPWQYRVLSERLVEGVLQACARFHVPRPILVGFVSFRLLQNLALFALAAAYWRRVRLNLWSTLLAMGMLAWAMSHMLYDSDLSFNTYTDAIAYLAAALLIVSGRWWPIVPLAALAAFNRETGGLIPIMLLATALTSVPAEERKRGYLTGLLALLAFCATYLAMRYAYGPRPPAPGLGASPLDVNLLNPHAWAQMVLTFGVLPVLTFFSFRAWPRPLRVFFWAVVPLWMLIHVAFAHIAETRLFLVPLAVVIVPGSVYALQESREEGAVTSRADAEVDFRPGVRAEHQGSAAA